MRPTPLDSDEAQVRAACEDAARLSPWWGSRSGGQRAEVLEALAAALDGAAERLVPIAESETKLGEVRLRGEVGRTSFQLRLLAGASRAGTYGAPMVDEPVPGAPPAGHPELRRYLVPIGPVAVYAASNFPFAFSVAGGDTASALAAGCPVVVKSHPGHPQTSEAVLGVLRSALVAAGAPPQLIGMVSGFDAGIALINDPAIRAAAFTGSKPGGRALFDLACARPSPIPFYGELGSVNPVVVLPSAARRPDLAQGYVSSLLLGNGQFCTNPSVLLVPAGDPLVEAIVRELDGHEPAAMLHRGIAEGFDRAVAEVAAVAGVVRLTGDAPASGAAAAAEQDLRRAPLLLGTSVEQLLRDPTPLQVECFGPMGLVVEYAHPDQLPAALELIEGALVGCVHADASDPAAAEVIACLSGRVGRVAWNTWPTGVAVTAAQHHGGPWPATTSPLHTSVGVTAIRRFLRPVVYESVPLELVPPERHTPVAHTEQETAPWHR